MHSHPFLYSLTYQLEKGDLHFSNIEEFINESLGFFREMRHLMHTYQGEEKKHLLQELHEAQNKFSLLRKKLDQKEGLSPIDALKMNQDASYFLPQEFLILQTVQDKINQFNTEMLFNKPSIF
ncbi:hypothetical protein [Rhabdochlamydiaceae symbiont of Dictyostelium giganteum]|uniref:hypothetical protein n=1 Tax=Rhabdochlamydiaceae symbiont of Dictyostelium giganteum TaxID=3342349 RepID=UPI00384D358C